MELITVKQGINLGLPAQANVVQHGHALFLHSLDQLFNLCVELSIVSPDLVKGLDWDDKHIGLWGGSRAEVDVLLHDERVLAKDRAGDLYIIEHKVFIMEWKICIDWAIGQDVDLVKSIAILEDDLTFLKEFLLELVYKRFECVGA